MSLYISTCHNADSVWLITKWTRGGIGETLRCCKERHFAFESERTTWGILRDLTHTIILLYTGIWNYTPFQFFYLKHELRNEG